MNFLWPSLPVVGEKRNVEFEDLWCKLFLKNLMVQKKYKRIVTISTPPPLFTHIHIFSLIIFPSSPSATLLHSRKLFTRMNKNYFFLMQTLNALSFSVKRKGFPSHTRHDFFCFFSSHLADYHSRAAFFLSSSNIFRPAWMNHKNERRRRRKRRRGKNLSEGKNFWCRRGFFMSWHSVCLRSW